MTPQEPRLCHCECTADHLRCHPVAPVAQEPPARWVKPAMRPPTDAEVAECTECDSDGCHPEVDMRKPVGGKCWFGCEKPINPPPDPMWCADPAPGSAQEQADPPLAETAIQVVARRLVHERLEYVNENWEAFPEIGEHDFDRVCDAARAMVVNPTVREFSLAYSELEASANKGQS